MPGKLEYKLEYGPWGEANEDPWGLGRSGLTQVFFLLQGQSMKFKPEEHRLQVLFECQFDFLNLIFDDGAGFDTMHTNTDITLGIQYTIIEFWG